MKWEDATTSENGEKPVELSPNGFLRQFTNKSDLKITSYWWPAANAKAVVLLVHGHGSYVAFDYLKMVVPGNPKEYAGSWIERFNAAGYSVCGIDFQGCGRSEALNGLTSHFESFQDLLDDVIELAVAAKGESGNTTEHFAGLPIFLGGISMGGCVVAQVLHQRGDLFAGGVLLAPMLSLEKISKQLVNRVLKPFSKLLSVVVPTWGLVKVERNVMFPLVQEDLDKDPLIYHGWTRVRSATEYVQSSEETVQAMPDMTFPFIVFHSRNDTMTDPEGSQMLYDRSKSADKTLHLLDSMWHGLTREVGNESVREQILEW
eukprot:CAMPEP_0198218088 /NCGR_PEP_ID=MMETSP1445-20131203/67289_1 /TAXON_ID=36898 /ORGANISM="Pyramimonas sp., Strain CCMP2087" /LENGTH=316 /DNA_ID=CAMNT_0043894979 /DNA_START=174 /DNA_END=1121 /DNA_ORIENTATION=-